MNETVKGVLKSHTLNRGFVYEYVCADCGGKFKDVAPEVSFPALCHGCYTGQPQWRKRKNRKRKEENE